MSKILDLILITLLITGFIYYGGKAIDTTIANQDRMLCNNDEERCEAQGEESTNDPLEGVVEEDNTHTTAQAIVEPLTASVSAYNALPEQTQGDPTTMASGKKVYEGAIACPTRFPFGTQIELEGLGVFTCEDRMNSRYRDGEYFDIFMWSYDEAVKFGRRNVNYVIK